MNNIYDHLSVLEQSQDRIEAINEAFEVIWLDNVIPKDKESSLMNMFLSLYQKEAQELQKLIDMLYEAYFTLEGIDGKKA